MAKVHKTLRLDPGIAERVSALKGEGETEAAAYCRVIESGLSVLEEGHSSTGNESERDTAPTEQNTAQEGPAFQIMSDYIDTLKDQLSKKDEQITALNKQLERADVLEAMELNNQPKALETKQEQEQRKGFFARLLGL